jgi:hypothetical protein
MRHLLCPSSHPSLVSLSLSSSLPALILDRQVRKKLKKKRLSAIAIQKVLLGWLQRKRFQIFRRRMHLHQHDEKERRARLQRIRSQEKEFAILRQLPMEGYLDFERLKLGSAARYSLVT